MTIARSGADGLHTEQLRWRRRGHPAEDYLIRARVPAGTPRTGIAVDILVEDTSQREARVARAGIGGLQMVVAARSTDIAWGALPCATAVVGCRAATQSCSPRCESRPGAAVPDPVRGAVVDVPIGSEPAWCVCDVDDGRICPATAKDVSQDLDVILPLATTAAATVRAEPDQPEVAAGSVGLESVPGDAKEAGNRPRVAGIFDLDAGSPRDVGRGHEIVGDGDVLNYLTRRAIVGSQINPDVPRIWTP